MSPPNPGVPYVKLYIGGVDVTKPLDRRLISFNVTWDPGEFGKFHFELLDKNFTFIERLIEENWVGGNSFQYGWFGASGKGLWSDTHYFRINTYKPEIYDRFAKISFDGVVINPEVAVGGSNPITRFGQQISYVIKEKSAADVARKLFKEMGYDVSLVENTKEFAKVHNSVDSTLADYPTFIITNQAAIQTFLNEIRYWAIDPESGDAIAKETGGQVKGSANNGKGGYHLYFIDSNPPKVGMTTFNGGDVVATFDLPVNHGGKREVVSFVYNSSTQVGTTQGDGAERVFAVDRFTGIGYSLRTQFHKKFPGASGQREVDIKIHGGINGAQIINYADGGSQASMGALRQYVQSSHGIKLSQQLSGSSTLTLLGRTDIKLHDCVKLNVWMNYWINNQPSKELHFHSGTWVVLGFSNTIMGGQFNTKLDLKKISGITAIPETGMSVNLYTKENFNVADDPDGGGSMGTNMKNPDLLFTDTNTLGNFS